MKEKLKGYLRNSIEEHLIGRKKSVVIELYNIELEYAQLLLDKNGVIRDANGELTYKDLQKNFLSGDFYLRRKDGTEWEFHYRSYGEPLQFENKCFSISGIGKIEVKNTEELVELLGNHIVFVH